MARNHKIIGAGLVWLLVGWALLSMNTASFAAILVHYGNDPVCNMGWPKGAEEVANLSSRLGYWEGPPFGGGQYTFLYRCKDTNEFNEALKVFAKIEESRLELVVHDGPEYNFWLKIDKKTPKEDARVDWTFLAWVPANWNRLYNNPNNLFLSDHPDFRKPVAPPKIDVYIGGGTIKWDEVQVPSNVTVIDKRAESAPIKPVGGGLVQGTVRDMTTGKAIAGAEIRLVRRLLKEEKEEGVKEYRVTSDKEGLFQVEKIRPGRYKIHIKAKGYVSRTYRSARSTIYHNKGNTYYKLDAQLVRPASIKGVVIDTQGNPLSGIEVSARNSLGTDGFGYSSMDNKAVTTDERGRFEIKGLPRGRTNLKCKGPSLHQKSSIHEIYKVPAEKVTLVMEGTGIVRGKVMDTSGIILLGEKYLHINIDPIGDQINRWSSSANCKADGSFEFNKVPPGDYQISGSYLASTDPPTYRRAKEIKDMKITVRTGQTVELEIPYTPAIGKRTVKRSSMGCGP
ncbi:MAG: MSCRAMM family protein [Planctomycetota bacterium]|jgi:hypothetical protein